MFKKFVDTVLKNLPPEMFIYTIYFFGCRYDYDIQLISGVAPSNGNFYGLTKFSS